MYDVDDVGKIFAESGEPHDFCTLQDPGQYSINIYSVSYESFRSDSSIKSLPSML